MSGDVCNRGQVNSGSVLDNRCQLSCLPCLAELQRCIVPCIERLYCTYALSAVIARLYRLVFSLAVLYICIVRCTVQLFCTAILQVPVARCILHATLVKYNLIQL